MLRSRRRTNIALYVVALLTACTTALVGVVVVRAVQEEPAPALAVEAGGLTAASAAERREFSEVVAAATEVATAFVNIRYDDVDASIERVRALATGEFAEQYDSGTDELLELLGGARAVMTGEVVWAGVVTAAQDSATVIVATTGTVANDQTDQAPVARTFRLQIQLSLVEGAWKASDLQFVEGLA
ncbi:hypothetical protein [Nocardioides nanhaiensis]|uniref:Mce-associated membrane protein n=1 Tax=Nocardioides nanhaiensis TaxID=1476871 RepID=A0ABP8WJ59_9ACTN